jgi:hypothetical protein
LPTRFGYDKRRAHLSSLVLAEQMTRDEALRIMEIPPFDERKIAFDKEFIAKKLKISINDLDDFLTRPLVSYKSYDTNEKKMKILRYVLFFASLPKIIFRQFFCKKHA